MSGIGFAACHPVACQLSRQQVFQGGCEAPKQPAELAWKHLLGDLLMLLPNLINLLEQRVDKHPVA